MKSVSSGLEVFPKLSSRTFICQSLSSAGNSSELRLFSEFGRGQTIYDWALSAITWSSSIAVFCVL